MTNNESGRTLCFDTSGRLEKVVLCRESCQEKCLSDVSVIQPEQTELGLGNISEEGGAMATAAEWRR